MEKAELKLGDLVYVPRATNPEWCGAGSITSDWSNTRVVIVRMHTGRFAGHTGGFPTKGVRRLIIKRLTVAEP